MKTTGILAFIVGLGLTLFAAIKFFTSQNVDSLNDVSVTHYHPAYLIWVPLIGITLFGIGVVLLWQMLTEDDRLHDYQEPYS